MVGEIVRRRIEPESIWKARSSKVVLLCGNDKTSIMLRHTDKPIKPTVVEYYASLGVHHARAEDKVDLRSHNAF